MKKRENLISIIVPIYKSEDYLERCVNSLVNQSYKNIEIILVYNQNSNDRCPEICINLEQRFGNIKLIHQDDVGPSEARNAGLKKASGRYVVFVDSDDFVSPNIIESLKNDLDHHDVQLSMCGFQRYPNSNRKKYYSGNGRTTKKITDQEAFNLLMETQELCALWAKMYDISLFDDVSLPVTRNEDMFVMPELFKKAKRLTYTTDVHYYYSQEGTSLVRSRHTLESVSTYYDASKYWWHFAEINYPTLSEKARLHFFKNVIDLCRDLIKDPNHNLFDKLLELKQEISRNSPNLLKSPNFSFKNKIKTLLLMRNS